MEILYIMKTHQKIQCLRLIDKLSNAGRYIFAFMAAIALSSKAVVLENYQSSSPLGKIIELAAAQFGGSTILTAFLCIVLVYLGTTRDGIRGAKVSIDILAVVFAAFCITGKSFAANNNLKYIVGNPYQFGFAVFGFCGYIWFFRICINYLMDVIEAGRPDNTYIFNNGIDQKLMGKENKALFFLFILCWLPYLVIFYPGSVPYDGYLQLNMFYGIDPATNHHPWFSTLVMGSLHRIGGHVSDNFGVFVVILAQSFFCAFVFSRICKKIISYQISKRVKICSVLFYAIVPTWGAYAQALIKDTVYYGLFGLFMIYYIEMIETKKFSDKRHLLLFLMVSCAAELYRNEAVYILIPSIMSLMIIMAKKEYKKIILSLTVVLLVHIGFKQVIFPIFDVREGSVKEMLSVPFQQTARYVIKHEEELTDDEIETIDQVLSYQTIKEKYDPNISDPVKNTYRNPHREILIKYFRLWIKQFTKDPNCYIEAALNHCFGYYYPEFMSKKVGNMQFYIKGEPLATGDLDIFYVHSEELRNNINKLSHLWLKLPVLSLLMYPATYTWILLFLTTLMIRKNKWRDLTACVPVFLTIAICTISPVNGYMRYMLPVMAATPLLAGFCLNAVKTKEG